jgi:serine/threonine protein kinase
LDKHIKINDADGPLATKVFEICDNDTEKPLVFGQSLQPSTKNNAIDWLWNYGGKLLVIAAPYYYGMHSAKQPLHFLPIINHLEQLHKQGIVHGDIRAYNMVLNYDTSKSITTPTRSISDDNLSKANSSKGWLIDFDFGGQHDVVTYPKGYKDFLRDGERPGKVGGKITIMDDWKSLIGLILYKYDVVDRPGSESVLEKKSFTIHKMRKELLSYAKKRVDSSDPLQSNFKIPADHLREYINYVSDVYDVEPNSSFQTDLEECGLWISEAPLLPSDAVKLKLVEEVPFNASGVASGSPQTNH